MNMKIHRGNQPRARFARTLFLLAIITIIFQIDDTTSCQAASPLFFKRRHTSAFLPPSSSLSSIRQAGRNELHDEHISTSLPMTFLDSSSHEVLSTLQQSTQLLLTETTTATSIQPTLPIDESLQIEQLSPTTTLIVFIIGIIPFIWATIEFWRRIAVGASFGTGSDSVVIPSPFDNNNEEDDDGLISIGEDGNPLSSRGRRTLDRGALGVAYVLFGVAAFSVGIAVASVIMGPNEGSMPL